MTIKIEFLKEDIDSLMYQRFHHPHPRVQQKMEALLLKSKRIDNTTICEVLGICPNTLRTYFKQFQSDGVEGLKEMGADTVISQKNLSWFNFLWTITLELCKV